MFVLLVWRLDENVAGVYEEGEFSDRQAQETENFAEQGKLLHWACIYLHLFRHKKLFKSTNDFENLLQVHENYFATYVEV